MYTCKNLFSVLLHIRYAGGKKTKLVASKSLFCLTLFSQEAFWSDSGVFGEMFDGFKERKKRETNTSTLSFGRFGAYIVTED